MINIIYGSKGSGKTKRIIANANERLKTEKGEIVFITDTDNYTPSVDNEIRYINIKEYNIETQAGFCGFICGMLAANSDIHKIFIDGINRFLIKVNEMQNIFDEFENISAKHNVALTLTINTEDLPEFVKKYQV